MVLPAPNLKQAAFNPTAGQTSQSTRITAPVGGWNVLDSIAAMDPIYALILDNVFPTTSQCVVRNGFVEWATGLTGQVETLFQWGGPSATHFLAASNHAVYDITAGGAVGAALASGYTNNRWQYTNFGTPGGQFVVACNGADTPWNYDGSAISTSPAITGITPEDCINVCAYRERLFFVLKNSMTYAYLAVNTIGGAASTIDLSSFFPLGGKLIAIGTWSRAGLTDQQDLIVFFTSKGEFVIFSGSDPGDATKWSLENRGRIGAPVGDRCLKKIGTDLYIICQDGLVAFSQVMWLDRVDVSKTISTKIGTAINQAVSSYGSNFGWEIFLYPKGNLAFVNIPFSEGIQIYQYVVNTATGAWCRFKNLNGNCWELFGENPYFGGTDGKVYKWDVGLKDNGANITWEARSAFLDMGQPGQNKQWNFIRPIFQLNGNASITISLEVDYNLTYPAAPATPTVSGAEWDVAQWDHALWGNSNQVQSLWAGGNVIGRVVAVHMRGAAKSQSVSWLATDFNYIQAGLI